MDRIKKIDQEKKNIIANYEENWDKMMTEWNKDDNTDSFWLTFSACYLFKTGKVRWALDPVSLLHRMDAGRDESELIYKHKRNFVEDFKKLSFVLLSHYHVDHYDFRIIDSLSSLPIKVVVSEQLFPIILKDTEMPKEKLIILKNNESINICGIKITAFDGFHDNGMIQVPSNSYLIDSGKCRMFFSGDVREYNKDALPPISLIDFYFAHLWLGGKSALLKEYELLKPFCEFSSKLNPKKIFITHLFEVARIAEDYWNNYHSEKVENYLMEHYPEINVETPQLNHRVIL